MVAGGGLTGTGEGAGDASLEPVGIEARLERLERIMRDVVRTQAGIAKELEEIATLLGPGKGLHGRAARTQEAIDSVLRRLFLTDDVVEYPHRLTAQRFRLTSQNLEDGMIVALVREAGITDRRFVEIGCGYQGGNSGTLAHELGWSGLMVDGGEERVLYVSRMFNPERVTAVCSWVTRENINELIESNGLTGEVGFMSVDIDGNDYWLWDALTVVTPQVFVIEYNAAFGDERAVVVPYKPDFDRHHQGRAYYGASLPALVHLGARKGYRLVGVEPRGVNAFFLREGIAPHVPAVTPRSVYRHIQPSLIKGTDMRPAKDRTSRLYSFIEKEGLELVELDAADA
jgi:hypothetical protein